MPIKKKRLPDTVLPTPTFNPADERNTLVEQIPETPKVDPVVKGKFVEANRWYISAVVDSTYNPRNTLATFIRGMRDTVEYYQVVRDQDEALNKHSTETAAVYQQYRKIERLVMKVQSAISPTTDPKTQNVEASGKATLYCGLVPSIGDMLIVDLGRGRGGLFNVTSAQRVNLYKHPIFVIEYDLVAFVSQRPDLVIDLEKKVVETRVYHEDFLLNGTTPFLLPAEREEIATLERALADMIDYYLGEFYNSATQSLVYLLPDDVSTASRERGYGALYDPYLVDFVKSTFDVTYPAINQLQRTGSYTSRKFTRENLWSLLLDRRNKFYPNMVYSMGLYGSAGSERAMPVMGGSEWGNVDYSAIPVMDLAQHAINPRELSTQTASNPALRLSSFDSYYYKQLSSKSYAELLGLPVPLHQESNNAAENDLQAPIIYPVGHTDAYVLSPYFYKQELGMVSTLESAINDYLNNERINVTKMKLIVNDMVNWSTLDRFYLTPIVYVLLKMVVEGW